MLQTRIEEFDIQVGERFRVTFQRTLRLPDDGREYPLPPGLGAFPVHRAADFPKVPEEWRRNGDAFIPLYQREALWLGFNAASWKPNAVQVGVGNINAVSGGKWKESLTAKPQDYLVCPEQPWLDGINVGEGRVRQFIAMPVGSGYTVESQMGVEEEAGGLRITVYEPVAGRFPDQPPPRPPRPIGVMAMAAPPMGIAAGGTMKQKIYPDQYGIETWDQENRGSVFVHIVDSETYRELTGRDAPPSPVSAKTYTEYGLPWFELYDEEKGTLEAGSFGGLKTVGEGKDKPLEVKRVRKLRS